MPSTTFLFWNVNRKPLAGVVADLADANQVDVIILAECETEPAIMLRALNEGRRGGFHLPPGLSKRVMIFTRFSRDFLIPTFEHDRLSIRRLALPARSELLLVAVHLPSKLHWSNESQAFECTELARLIANEEDRAGHRRTVAVGDFNMNPFEFGFIAAA